jgi:phenylpyruvate tautomerase PptA (4-oxalocrotonate tautomerase family)
MPLTRVSLRRGKSAAYKNAILDGLYEAMRETYNVPERDYFMLVQEFDEGDFRCSPDYLGVARSDDLVVIELTVSNTRNLTQKRSLYQRIVEKLAGKPGVRSEDVFINLVETLPENWSMGNGAAQYATEETA